MLLQLVYTSIYDTLQFTLHNYNPIITISYHTKPLKLVLMIGYKSDVLLSIVALKWYIYYIIL